MSAALVLLLSIVGSAQARGPSPYLPYNLAPEIERDVERVLILADKPTLTRPIAAAWVLEALPTACRRDAALCARVRRYLDSYMERVKSTHLSIEGAGSSGAAHNTPNRHGLATDSSWVASAAGHVQFGDYFIVNGGVVADADNADPTGSFVSTGFDFAQLDIGYRDHGFSPMTDSSMLIGSNAATMPSVTLSNYRPLTGLGLQYELFLAEMSYSSDIAYQGSTTEGKPRLGGIHVAIEPVPGWALSGNRLVQFGGGARGGRGAGDFLRALFKPHNYDNTSATLNSDQEFGNQVAAWTSRLIVPGRIPFSVYYEYAGEDTSYSGNYRLGNSALSMGLDFPQLWERFDLTYEVSEWQNGWYVHGIYRDGLTNDGHVIGHWFGDARQRNDGVGGQSHMLRLGWHPGFGGVAEFRYRTLANETYTGVDYSRAHDFTLRYSYPLRRWLVGGEVNAGRDVFGDGYSRIAAFARFGAELSGGGYASTDADDARVQYFVDVGGSASRLRIELSDGAPKYITPSAYAPHFSLGVRRAASEHSDFGTRIEFDNIEDHLLIAVRALDYRYRWNRHFATTFFAGAARYNLATPAFGYYGGFGAQWLQLTRNLDLSLDIRYGDKLARDKLLPSDPITLPDGRPDVFYDLMGATLSLSYRL